MMLTLRREQVQKKQYAPDLCDQSNARRRMCGADSETNLSFCPFLDDMSINGIQRRAQSAY